MAKVKVCLLLACFVFSYAELLGPEAKKDEKKDTTDDDEELDLHTKVNEDFLSDINRLLSSDLTELRSQMIEETNNEVKGHSPAEADLLQRWAREIKQSLKQEYQNPDDLLNALPPVPEEEQTELTPEQQEAKELFDAASARLARRPADPRAALQQVQRAAERGWPAARVRLAWALVFGEGVHMDPAQARDIFAELAAQGNADAHAGMGFLHAAGVGVPVSQARALVHYTLGALGGSAPAELALAYRRWAGVTVPGECQAAIHLYMRVAGKVASGVSLSGGPAVQRVRITDDAESLDTDLIEYYQLLAEKGDVNAQVGLGQLHFQGGRGVTLDVSRALHYFTQAANAGHAVANAFLGKIYLEGGDGVRADNATALRYFRKAADMNNAVGQAGLGLMYLQGRGVARDPAAALKYFTMSANQGWAEGQLHLGLMYFTGAGVPRDYKQANKYFSLASQSGHVLALHQLANMHALGLGVPRSCTTAVELYKNVCERGPWGARLMAAHAAWRARDARSAYLQYLALAEQGYEVAQSNAAYLLDSGEVTMYPDDERYTRALQLWGRSAAQGYSAARVKCGDYHYYGLGTPRDLEAAAHHYRIASEQQHNAQAMFNLGYMHERGLGLAKDLHLAKRCYDLAADASPEARLPAALALAALSASAAVEGVLASLQSPALSALLAGAALPGDWDLWLLGALVGALGVVLRWRARH